MVWRDLEEEEEKFIKILFDQLGSQNLFFGQSGQNDPLHKDQRDLDEIMFNIFVFSLGAQLKIVFQFFLLPLGAQLKLTHQTTSLQVQTHLAFSQSTQINRL